MCFSPGFITLPWNCVLYGLGLTTYKKRNTVFAVYTVAMSVYLQYINIKSSIVLQGRKKSSGNKCVAKGIHLFLLFRSVTGTASRFFMLAMVWPEYLFSRWAALHNVNKHCLFSCLDRNVVNVYGNQLSWPPVHKARYVRYDTAATTPASKQTTHEINVCDNHSGFPRDRSLLSDKHRDSVSWTSGLPGCQSHKVQISTKYEFWGFAGGYWPSYSRVLTVIKFSLHSISFNKSLGLECCIDTSSPTTSSVWTGPGARTKRVACSVLVF